MRAKSVEKLLILLKQKALSTWGQGIIGWFYKLALLDFELIFEVKMQESEGV